MPNYAGVGSALRVPRGGRVRSRGYRRGGVIGLEVVGLRQAERIPPGLQQAFEGMMRHLESALVTDYRSFVPGSPTGRLGSQVQARRLARNTIVVGTFGSKFAKALNRGFTSKAIRGGGKALRFDDGSFRRVVHVEGKHFHEKALVSAPPIVEAIYMDFFYDPRELRF